MRPPWGQHEPASHPAVVAGWIAESQAERQRAERHQHTPVEEKTNAPALHSEEQIMAVVEELGDLVSALQNAEPEHKLEVYAASGCTCRTTQNTNDAGKR
ncbi:hypothetical protein ACFWRG_07620 [Micromonospora tulbaghiae]|uniref:hypothetical protein n=1 Tax=Micromonospora tulbaghiae TaxID=479978 RepID=UPI00364BF56E